MRACNTGDAGTGLFRYTACGAPIHIVACRVSKGIPTENNFTISDSRTHCGRRRWRTTGGGIPGSRFAASAGTEREKRGAGGYKPKQPYVMIRESEHSMSGILDRCRTHQYLDRPVTIDRIPFASR